MGEHGITRLELISELFKLDHLKPSSFNCWSCQDGSTAWAAGAMGGGECCMGSSVSAAGRVGCGLRDLRAQCCMDLHGSATCFPGLCKNNMDNWDGFIWGQKASISYLSVAVQAEKHRSWVGCLQFLWGKRVMDIPLSIPMYSLWLVRCRLYTSPVCISCSLCDKKLNSKGLSSAAMSTQKRVMWCSHANRKPSQWAATSRTCTRQERQGAFARYIWTTILWFAKLCHK